MKSSRNVLLSRSDRVSSFRPRIGGGETSTDRVERAWEMIEKLKRVYEGESLLFDYQHERIQGKFVTAMEGEMAGTCTVVLRIPSSRICSGPCVLRVGGQLMEGVAVTGKDGNLVITARVDG